MQLRNIARVIVPVLLMVAFCFITNATINQHFHKLSSGIVVKHAHPFEKEGTGKPFQEHHHNQAELVYLELTSNSAFRIYLFIILLIPLLFLFEITRPLLVGTYNIPELYFLENYHAPPVFTS